MYPNRSLPLGLHGARHANLPYPQTLHLMSSATATLQGRETSFMFFLVSGEVQVVADLPDSSDPLVLGAALAALGGTKPTQAQVRGLCGARNELVHQTQGACERRGFHSTRAASDSKGASWLKQDVLYCRSRH